MIIKVCIAIMLLCTVAITVSAIWLEWKLKKIWREYDEWRQNR